MATTIFLNNGAARDPKTRHNTHGATARKADTVTAYPGESLASITIRAYGANTPELRQKIVSANGNLKGNINVPR